MKVNNPSFISFDGTPITGVVPPRVRVDGGQALTQPQQSGVNHAYTLFRTAVQTAVGSYMVQNRVLEDGTRVRMVSMMNQDTVFVFPAKVAPDGVGRYRGFVISPKFFDGTPPVTALDTTILTATATDGTWCPAVVGYKPGEKRTALSYMVSPTAWDGDARTAPQTLRGKKFRFFVGKKIRGLAPLSTEKFNNVFTAYGKRLYKNAIPVDGFDNAIPDGFPAVFASGAQYAVTVANDSGVTAVTDAALVTAYSWQDVAVFAAPGVEFGAGVEIQRTPVGLAEEYQANFLRHNVTIAGAVQTWRATVKLLADAPYVTVVHQGMSQLNVAGALADYSGWEDTEPPISATPILGTPTTASTYCGWECSRATGALIGPTVSTQWVANSAGGYNMKRVFNKTYSQPETVPINVEESIVITRFVTVESETTNVSVNYSTSWPYTSPLINTNIGIAAADIVYSNSVYTFGASPTHQGQSVGSGYDETGTLLEHTDTAVCSVELIGLPEKIYSVEIDHEINGRTGYMNHHEAVYSPVLGCGVDEVYPNVIYFINKYADGWGTINRVVHESVHEKLGTNRMVASARDFIFCDRANEVFVYIEAEVLSEATDEVAAIGSSSVVISKCIRFGGVTRKTAIYAESFPTPRSIPQTTPWGIYFGFSNMNFWYTTPTRPHPVYAPTWQDQGSCPYIAYTTVAESATTTPRCTAHFRLQLLKKTRGIWEDEPPVLPNCIGFSPYMVEQLLLNTQVGLALPFAALEAVPTIISLAVPDSGVFGRVGAPDDDATEYANFYRT